MTTEPGQPLGRDNIDSRLDRLVTTVEDLTSGIAQISEDIRINRLDLTELKEITQRQAETVKDLTSGIAEIGEDMRANRLNLTELKETTQRQAETTDRLVRIVELLVERTGQ